MRVLVASYNARTVGGAEATIRAMLGLLQARGIEAALLTRSPPAPTDRDRVASPGVTWLDGAGRSPDDYVRLAADWNPTVVYSHVAGEPEIDAALARSFPTVHYAHNYGGMCVSGTKCHSFPAARPCARPLGPGCLAAYLPLRCGGLNPVIGLQMYRRERRRQQVFSQYRAVLVASRHMAGEVVRNGVSADRVRLIPPFPTDITPDLDPPVARPQTGRVLFLGRVTALKGWDHLITAIPLAAAELGRPLSLVVVGDGPDLGRMQEAVSRDRVTAEILGRVSADRRNAEMRAADVIAVPSVWPEPFGLIGIEAGCVGVPAVGYALGGIPDWLVPGVSGEAAPGDRPDPRQLAAALVRVLADPDHWQRLRVGAWETARRFTPERHLDLLMPILEAAAR